MSQRTVLLVAAIIVLIISIPLVFKWVPQNQIYGVRTKRTLADRDLWYRANRFMGWALVASSAISIVSLETALNDQYAFAAFFMPLAIAVISTLIYLKQADK